MRRILLLTLSLIVIGDSSAQNVGIGTTSPGARLHVMNGSSGFNSSYFPGAAIEGNTNTYVNIIAPDANETALLFGRASDASSGGIVYNNTETAKGLQFRTNGNVTRMIISQAGNVGIGTTAPGFPLTFAPFLGDKISLWGNTGPHYGIGIQSGLLQLHTDGIAADIAFGYGTSSAFTETMRAKGTGILQFPASVGKKIVLYPGSTGDVGFSVFGFELRLASDNPVADISFGYDQHQSGFTERFRMKGNGAFVVNGSQGLAGQVLTSFAAAPPQWTSSTNTLYNNSITLTNTTGVTLTTADGFVALPGMSYSFSLAGNAKVFISYSVPVAAVGCAFCGGTTVYIDVNVNGIRNNRSIWDVDNAEYQTLSFSKIISLGAGNHTVQLLGSAIGPSVIFGPCCSFEKLMNIQIIPQ